MLSEFKVLFCKCFLVINLFTAFFNIQTVVKYCTVVNSSCFRVMNDEIARFVDFIEMC